jgi:hypothetical protein
MKAQMLIRGKAPDQRHVGEVAEGCSKTCQVLIKDSVCFIAQQNSKQSLVAGYYIIPDKMALALAAAALAEAEQPAQPGIGCAIRWIDEQRRSVGQIESAPDDKADACIPGGLVSTHDAGE